MALSCASVVAEIMLILTAAVNDASIGIKCPRKFAKFSFTLALAIKVDGVKVLNAVIVSVDGAIRPLLL